MNHFAYVCKAHRINILNDQSETFEVESLFIGNISLGLSDDDWCEMVQVNNQHNIKVKLDTGAHRNVISIGNLKKLCTSEPNLEKFTAKLTDYGGSQILVLGKCYLKCKFINRSPSILEFIVVDESINVPTGIGSPTIKQLKLVQRVDIVVETPENSSVNSVDNEFVKKYKKVFSGIGCIKDFVYDIKLNENAIGKVLPCRKVPVALIEPLKQELGNMEKAGIIEKVNGPSNWVNQLVIVRKANGNLRICLDPTYLIRNISRKYFKIPTFEDLCSRMPDAKVFTTLDANKAFWPIKLTKKFGFGDI